ncbi:kinase-like domain-containing protein [Diplogelasinospora grovesii]|uniref:EKC/KEOPS complex subunit BUD32 n=1 Tax=Diplogelasinospora grovesii TaxID=303347 RepID=A0AAN6S6U2_9PEZI|nr:kinase-like domain-containing protein [Diplogelasinospora grovesii]
MADGLAYLHRAGVCHGDLTHANVLFGLRDIDRWSDSEVYQHFGAPKEAQLLLCLDDSLPPPSAPRHIVEAINFRDIDSGLLSGNICIVDFGLSFFTERPPPGIPGTPRSFLAPELCFGAPRSPANDVWALGCLIFELYTGWVLFPLIFDQLDLLVGTIVDTLGQLPPHWEGRFANQADRVFEPGQKDFWYDPSFELGRPLECQIVEKCPQLPEHQSRLLLQLLASSLSLDPANRLSAAEIVSHAWFSQGDIPEQG